MESGNEARLRHAYRRPCAFQLPFKKMKKGYHVCEDRVYLSRMLSATMCPFFKLSHTRHVGFSLWPFRRRFVSQSKRSFCEMFYTPG